MAELYGILSTGTTITNVCIQSISDSETAEEISYKDITGWIKKIDVFGGKYNVDVEGIIEGAVDVHTRDTITHDTIAYTITSVKKSQKCDGYSTFSCSAVAKIAYVAPA